MQPGTRIGHFEILAPLGSGGMGEVYHARDVRLGRELALKLLHTAVVEDATATERFLREARAASALNHPNIVTVYDIGQGEGGWHIAMELVRGRTLGTFLGDPVDVRTVAELGAQAARALAVAHDASIVHRDVKPDNLMLRDDGYLKVLDFGLARLSETPDADGIGDPRLAVTRTGEFVGTLRYVSPEQACGELVGAPTDVFALGIVLYELLAGAYPFAAPTPMAVLGAILSREVEPLHLRRAEVPTSLAALVHAMLAKEAALRPTAAVVATALTRLHDDWRMVGAPLTRVPGAPAAMQGPAADAVPAGAPSPPAADARTPFVGRATDRARILEAWQRAAAGRGQLLGVTGEPGVGKSTFVEACLADLVRTSSATVLRGRCSQRLAGAEAYLPILEALEHAVQGDEARPVRELARRLAPTWLAEIGEQSSPDLSVGGSDGTTTGLRAASPERMKREIVALLTEAGQARPLLIFLEDLHWADISTVDLLAYVGARLDGLRVLIVTTYRPSEMRLARHPFLPMQLDLQSRGLAAEIALDFLTGAEVGELLELRYPGHRFPSDFAALLHAKTEGNPLFLVDVLRWLGARGAIADFEGHWRLTGTVPDVTRDLPPSISGMIERKLEQLEDADRRLLAVAAVQGFAFDSAVVADALGQDQADVEDRLNTLDRVYALVRTVGEQELPDRTLSVRYRFVHVLYQNALHGALAPSRRVAIAARVATSLEARHGAAAGALAPDMASALAVLWEVARQPARAAGYFALAATRAAEVFAYAESEQLAARGLAQIEQLPDGPERRALEIGLRVSLGFTNVVTRGFNHPETYAQMQRAHELSRESGRTPPLVPVLWGMVVYHIASGQSVRAFAYAEEMLAIAAEAEQPLLEAMAESAMSGAALFRGELARSIASQRRAEALTTPEIRRGMRAIVGSDPLMLSRCQAARAHWMSGNLAEARTIFDRSVRDALASRDPRERAHVALHLAEFELALDRPDEAERVAIEALRVCDEYGVASERLWTAAYLGAAQAGLGRVDEGIATLRNAIDALVSFQSLVSVAEYQGFLAEALLAAGRADEALAQVTAGLAMAERTGEAVWVPELRRIHAAVILASDPRATGAASAEREAAVEGARAMGASLLERRAAAQQLAPPPVEPGGPVA